MDAYKTINDTLVHLFNEIWELEEKAIITEEFPVVVNFRVNHAPPVLTRVFF